MRELLYGDITHKIIGASFEVHKNLGCGFQEVVYQRALANEFSSLNLEYAREVELEIFYRNFKDPVGKRRVDFVIEKKVLIELKATSSLDDIHFSQLLNYLKAFKLKVGILVNFGERSLIYKRLVM